MTPSSPAPSKRRNQSRSEEHTSELQSQSNLVCRLLLEKKKKLDAPARWRTQPHRTAQEEQASMYYTRQGARVVLGEPPPPFVPKHHHYDKRVLQLGMPH